MKKVISLLLSILFLSIQYCEAYTYNNLRVNVEPVEGYQYKTVLKHYQPYSVGIVNDNSSPVLFTTKSEIKYIDTKGQEYLFPDNKTVYKKSRKRDVGRYCWVSLPCAAIGGGIIGITFGLGLIAGVGIAVAGIIPPLQAAKYNSKIAANMYIENKIPLSLTPKEYQMLYVFLPTKNMVQIEKVVITNLTLKDKPFDLTIPVGQGVK